MLMAPADTVIDIVILCTCLLTDFQMLVGLLMILFLVQIKISQKISDLECVCQLQGAFCPALDFV